MFSSKGLFRGAPCPRRDECLLPACWFSHEEDPTSDDNLNAVEYDPFTAGVDDAPPAKRRKLENLTETKIINGSQVKATPLSPKSAVALSADIHNIVPEVSKITADQDTPGREGDFVGGDSSLKATGPTQLAEDVSEPETNIGTEGHLKSSHITKAPIMPTKGGVKPPMSLQRPVTPPAKAVSTPETTASKLQTSIKEEVLRPRLLVTGPDWKIRDTLLKVLHKGLTTRNNDTIQRVKQGDKTLTIARLNPPELITLALDEEVELAKKFGAGVYQNVIKQRIHGISKLSDNEWTGLLMARVARVARLAQKVMASKQTTAQTPNDSNDSVGEVIPGMNRQGEVLMLRRLHQPLDKLQSYGYVTQPPGSDEVTEAQKQQQASAGWEKCDRCGTRFQIFPGRNEQGHLASGGRCRYHWGKPVTGVQNRLDRAMGGREARYSCCQQEVGSAGCAAAETHVFNYKDVKRLATVWQWEHTPERTGTSQPVSFDCEMAYTTNGMEVVRVTAVSWPSNRTLLDVLVRPFGEILDLNTRFSGVSRKMFADTPAYNATEQLIDPHTIRKVSSPTEARELLFQLITPDTPLIGHAIDNDLNTLRIIHPFVIDTVLLYPHKKGLPMRNALRILVYEHLDGRVIQNANDQGHDSREDAIATGDLVTKAVRTKWAALQAHKWQLQDGVPVKPGVGDANKL